MKADETGNDSSWSREQDRAFEKALATYPEESLDRWEKIAADVHGKTIEELKHHYEVLIDDLNRIESGCVPLPCYSSSSDGSTSHGGDEGKGKKGCISGNLRTDSDHGGGKGSKLEQERRKGIAWTEDEHRLFLLGLDKYGKGDWRSISRNFVVTRTPTQVASHAQKYFIRLNSINKDRRRSSIHDITNVTNGDISSAQAPITGSSSGEGSPVNSPKPPQLAAASPSMVGIFVGPTAGHVPAVGTPVAYSVRVPVPGQVVPGAPVNMGPVVTYPMPPTTAHHR